MTDHAQRVRWDRGQARDVAASIVSAKAVGGHIDLDVGQRTGLDAPGEAQGVALVRRFELRPLAAKRLHDMLAQLLAKADVSGGNLG